MSTCRRCGEKLRRIHRTFWQRFRFQAIYICSECHEEELVPQHYSYHFGKQCRCPHCGTARLSKLREPDRIDKMETGFFNLAARLGGGKLYHCRYCRVQFYDRRPLAERAPVVESAEVTTPQDKAKSGA